MTNTTRGNDLFQNIFEASIEGIIAVNEEGCILTTNPACEQLFGYTSGELTGKNIEMLIPEKLKLQYKIYIKQHIDPPKREIEIWGIKKEGTQFNLEIRLSSTVIEGKNVTIAFLRDTSNHNKNLQKIKQVNNKLRVSNHKFDTLINNVKGILFRCENNRDYTMNYISEGCLEITGYSFECFKDRTITYGQLILEADRNSAWEHIETAIKQKKSYDFEYRIQHKNGSIKYVWEKGEALYDNQGKVIALEGFVTDITAYKEQQLTIKSNEFKMKALLEAMPDMIFIQDRKGNYIDWYANNTKNLFIPPGRFIGVNMKDVLPASVYKKIKASHQKVIATGNMQIAEYSTKIQETIRHYEARVVLISNHGLLTIVRDVTEKKATDTQLNIRNNALASADNSIIIADAQQPEMPIIYSNTAFEKITGYKKEEVYGRNCNFLQDDDRDQKEIHVMKNAIKNGEACNVVLRNYRKDGTLFWNDVTITPVHNNQDKLTHFIGVQNDVTNKVKAEDLKDRTQKILELIAKDKPLKTIAKKIIDTAEIHLKECIGSILLLNASAKTLHVLAAPNLPKAFCNHIEGTAIGPKVGSCGTASFFKKEVIVSNIETNTLWDAYKEKALKNGLKACWAFPIMSSTNQVLGTFSVYSASARQPIANEKEMLLDMTYLASVAIEKYNSTMMLQESKKQLEEYAQKLEEKVQERTQEVMATVNELVAANLNLEDQILITEQAEKNALESKALTAKVAKNFPKGFIVVVNKALQLVLAEGEALVELGLKPLVFEGMTLDDLLIFSEKRKTKLKGDIEKTLAGARLSLEIAYKNKYFSVNTAPLYDENNQISYALHVYSDISHQKEIELNIQNALQKEQELNELKSRFVSMASHEFRTPLSAILTSAILIGKQNELGKESKREKYVVQIEKNVKHLVTILNDFLSLSKLEERKVMQTPERIDLVSFSKQLIKEINPTLKKGQTIDLKSNSKAVFVSLDEKLVRHILNNLFSNASKYSEENTNVDFKISQSQEKVILQITDQGIGIPIEEQQYLFDRFFRAKNAANIEGTGLGLNIVQNYTRLMGGTIEVKSGLNKGTIFTVELPINK